MDLHKKLALVTLEGPLLDWMEEVRRNWEETNHEALRGLGLA